MNINPYLFFDGNCREAFEFYAQCLGVEVKAMLTANQMPADEDALGCAGTPNPAGDKIMHACIDLDGGFLMGSDWMSSEPFAPHQGFSVSLNISNPDEAGRVFKALSEGGQVRMPLDKTFFADAFGMLTDRFGVPWMINCQKNG